MEPQQIAIVADKWKVKTFKKFLDEGEFPYEEAPGVTDDTTLLMVVTCRVGDLTLVVRNAEMACQRQKMN